MTEVNILSIASIIILICLINFTVIGFIVGIVKGFSNVKTWAVEYLCATGLTIAFGAIA